MKRISMTLIVGLILMGVYGSSGLASAGPAAGKPESPRVAIKALDPIEFVAGKAVPGNKSLFVDYNHLRYLFVNQKNREQFNKDPKRYAIQGDGTCPVIPEAKADPDLATVYQGRIYTFATIPCMALFEKNPGKYLAKWPGNPDNQKGSPKN
jgi:YHS domain-containing protein